MWPPGMKATASACPSSRASSCPRCCAAKPRWSRRQPGNGHGSRGGPAGKARTVNRPGKRTASPAKAAVRQALAGGRPPLRRKAGLPESTAGRPQGKRGKGRRKAARKGWFPLQGFPFLGSRPRDVPQTSSRSRFRHGNDSAGERFFHVQVRFSPPARTGHHHL